MSARQLRASVNRSIRAFFEQRGVLEVETPLWSAAANPDPNIDSVQISDQHGGGFLRTSPEFALKRLLAADGEAIYELGKVFRSSESGRWHNPEFTMLEWYRPGFDCHQLIDEVVDLVQSIALGQGRRLAATRTSYQTATQAALAIDPLTASNQALLELVNQRGWFDGKVTRGECLDLMFSLGVASSWPDDRLTVVFDYPACQAALARIHPDDNRIAMRFELFWGSVELANGYDELLDADLLSQRFAAENKTRRQTGKPVMPTDSNLLAATVAGIEPAAGIALGVDRLLACLAGVNRIDQVINFPAARA